MFLEEKHYARVDDDFKIPSFGKATVFQGQKGWLSQYKCKSNYDLQYLLRLLWLILVLKE